MEPESALTSFEMMDLPPCRFIGKMMLARAGKSGDLCGALFRHYGDWVFGVLDGMKDRAAPIPHNAALVTWGKYDETRKMMEYTAGRFMRAETPVPEDMDFVDLPGGPVAVGFMPGGDHDKVYGQVRAEVKERGGRQAATWVWSAELYPRPGPDGAPSIGVAICCPSAG